MECRCQTDSLVLFILPLLCLTIINWYIVKSRKMSEAQIQHIYLLSFPLQRTMTRERRGGGGKIGLYSLSLHFHVEKSLAASMPFIVIRESFESETHD